MDNLSRFVSMLTTLAMATKKAHWNLRGPEFIAIHEMLDDFHEGLLGHIDTLAERIVQLGGIAPGTAEEVASAGMLPPYPVSATRVVDNIRELLQRYELTGRTCLTYANSESNLFTQDIYIQVGRDLDIWSWKLRSNL